ncbi:MAG: glycoside hydrolase family 9 protein [Oscillospiraceae bacterium]|nr:glycoside hydrolase family 9 protein [Oscillospiraceae bacterium]
MKRKKLTAALAAAAMLAGNLQCLPAAPASAAGDYDYARALQMSLYFYECQQAGKLPEWNRVEWRADSTVDDDVNGGWYDAGDHVKFNLPMAYSAAMLAWGLYEYPDGIESCGEMTNYVNNLKWTLDYLAECDLGTKAIFQVGLGQIDHSWWGPVELIKYGMADQGKKEPRGHLEGRDCSAVTAEMGAALAAGSVALKGRVDQSVLDGYVKHAINLFKMADEDRSDDYYQDSDAKGFYRSSHFYDELFWCANWLYIATGEQSYLDTAKSYIPNLGKEMGQDCLKYTWSQCWDDVQQGGTLLYAINTGDKEWIAQAKKHLSYWADDEASKHLKGGLCWVDSWGCLRYANTIGFLAAVGTDHLFKNDAEAATFKKLYETQINYTLGDNPNKIPYVCGYADNSPCHPHHRTAHGSWKNSDETPEESRHILYGALVGGPNEDGSFTDKRNNFVNNEVATDYNAGYTALLCKMVTEYGGKSDPKFPYPEVRDDEIFTECKVENTKSGSTYSLKITNHTAWPARCIDNLSMRVYVDLSEVTKAGFKASDVTVRCDRDQAGMYAGEGVKPAVISDLIQDSGDTYYIEVSFPDGRAVLPISEGRQQCEVILALVYPDYGSGWDATNDFSAQGLGSDKNTKTMNVPVYENGTLIYGKQPDGTVGKGSISAAPAPDGTPKTTDEPKQTEAPKQTTAAPSVTTAAPSVTTAAPAVTTEAPSSSGPNTPNGKWGDADESGEVDVSDAVIVARFAVGDKVNVTENGQLLADVTGDGNVTSDDALKIVRGIAGIIKDLDPNAKS